MIQVIFFILVAAITFKNKEAIDQGFCHLQNVKIQMLLDCKLNLTSTVTIALAENESDTSGNYILQCFGIPGNKLIVHDKMMQQGLTVIVTIFCKSNSYSTTQNTLIII